MSKKQTITFHKEYDCAIFPQRGTSASAGFDFFVPKPVAMNSNAFAMLEKKIKEECKNDADYESIIYQANVLGTTSEARFMTLLYKWNELTGRIHNSILLATAETPSIGLAPGENLLIPSGISADIPQGYVLDARNKSGVASKQGLIAGAELVDEDYTGIMHIDMHNISNNTRYIYCGMKIVQFMLEESHIYEVEQVNSEEPINKVTERGAGGFGSTGTQA